MLAAVVYCTNNLPESSFDFLSSLTKVINYIKVINIQTIVGCLFVDVCPRRTHVSHCRDKERRIFRVDETPLWGFRKIENWLLLLKPNMVYLF